MSAPEVTVIEDIRPLIAFVAPLIGVIGIAWAGEKRKNPKTPKPRESEIDKISCLNLKFKFYLSYWKPKFQIKERICI